MAQNEPYEINEQEIMFQSFGMDNPNSDPNPNDFSREQFEAAYQTLEYTDAIDHQLGVEILDDGKAHVSRDLLALYKTLVYRSVCDRKHFQKKASIFKQTTCFLAGALVLAFIFVPKFM